MAVTPALRGSELCSPTRKAQALAEETFFAGLRIAGVPENEP